MRRIPGLDVATDLSRIDVASNDVTVDRDGLEKLQLAHLTSVPFEDLDRLRPPAAGEERRIVSAQDHRAGSRWLVL